MDFLEKLTRILFTIVLGGIVAMAGLKIQWDRIGIETDALCFNQYKVVSELVNRTEVIQASLVKRYAERCGITEEAAGEELNEARAAIEMASADGSGVGVFPDAMMVAMAPARVPDPTAAPWPAAPPPDMPDPAAAGAGTLPPGQGNIAIGRAQTDTWAQVNFDFADGRPATGDGTAPVVGDILRARWEVNMRANLTLTTQGGNPVVGTLAKGDCVKILTAPENLRGQFWSRAERTACPA